jgi:hypothetical protein
MRARFGAALRRAPRPTWSPMSNTGRVKWVDLDGEVSVSGNDEDAWSDVSGLEAGRRSRWIFLRRGTSGHHSTVSTKRRRLTIIIAVAVVISAAGFTVQQISSHRVEREARSLSNSVEARLGHYNRADIDNLLAEDAVAGWEGRASAPFRVNGHAPQMHAEVRDGFVIRYRIEGVGTNRCVDALWPHKGRFSVSVNGCMGYRPPASRS